MDKATVRKIYKERNLVILDDFDNDRFIYAELSELPKELTRHSIISYTICKDEGGNMRLKDTKIVGSKWDAFRRLATRRRGI